MYVQEKNKISEVKVETPFEKRMREQQAKEQDGQPNGSEDQGPAPKSAEQIASEEQAVLTKYRELYDEVLGQESRIVAGCAEMVKELGKDGSL